VVWDAARREVGAPLLGHRQRPVTVDERHAGDLFGKVVFTVG
jgi:hypothetical protein